MQRELSCVWMRCGAACRQGLRMQRSMRMHFLLSAPSLVVGAPRRAVWQLKPVLHYSVSAAPRTIIFCIFFTIIAGKLFLNVQQWLVMMQL